MRKTQFMFWLAAAIAVAACSPSDPAALVASAKQYIEKRNFSASIIELKNALQKDPENAEARYLLGISSLENGDLQSAEIELNKAIDLGFKSEEAEVALARTILAKGAADKVLAQFEKRKLSTPKLQSDLRAIIGLAQLQRGNTKEAERTFDEALELNGRNVNANLGLARLAASQGEFVKASARIDAALDVSPSNLDALLLRADVLAAQGQGPSAENVYREAIEIAPHQVAPRLTLIMHLIRMRALDKAMVEVAALEGVAAKDARTSYAKALVLLEQRKFPAAREAILQVLKVAPDHVPSLIVAGNAAFETRAYVEAEGYLRKAVFKAPQALAAKRLLAATHLRMGQIQVALTEVKELLTNDAENPGLFNLAGETYLANGDVAGAAYFYERLKSLAPDNATVRTRLALVRFAAGDTSRGIAELEAASAADPQAYQADLALVATYLRRRDSDKALEALKVLEKKQPNNPVTHNLRGIALIPKGDYAAARASFERAVQLNPTYMPAIANLARLDLRDKKPEDAKKRYEAVLKKEPNNEQALFGLSVLLRVTGAPPQDIEKLLKHAVTANPASPIARATLINFYLRNRETKAALAAAQEAQVALPNNPAIVQAAGMAQLAASETRQAIASFTRLAELLPKSPEPQLLLARAHMAAKQSDEAIKALRAALALRPDLTSTQDGEKTYVELQPELASAQRDIAAIYVATGRNEDAVREAREVQANNPNQPVGYLLEGEIYVAQKKWDRAEQTYREALKKFDLAVLVTSAHAAMEAAGKPSEAQAFAEDWIKRHPKDAAVITYLAERALAGKRFAAAAEHYRRALDRYPDNPLFLNNLAWSTNELKQPQALEYAERAHELAPENPAIMDTLGWILAEHGQTERGLELLGRAAELAPEVHQIRLNLAKVLIKAGRQGAARKELEVLAKLDSRLPIQKEAAALLATQ